MAKNTMGSNEEGPRKQITLRDIAKELGISHVTVSLALRDHPRISAATRARVKAKAEKMGYHPDPMLSALSHYRLTSKEKPVQATLAWLNPLKEPDKLLKFEEFSLYRKGAETVARRLGFQLEEFRTEELSLKRLDTIFKTRSIRGLLLVPFGWETTELDWTDLPWHDYAAVRFGQGRHGPRLNFVTAAQASNTILAFEKVAKRGYKRIGFIGNSSPRRMFSAGYLKAQLPLPKSRQLSPLIYPWDSKKWDYALTKDLLAKWIKKEKPDAIITANIVLPELLTELGYSVPDDIAIATTSVHDTPIDAGIDQSPEEIGRVAVRTLVALLNEHHFGIPEIQNETLVEGTWVDGSMLPDLGS